jgi:thymidylate kinase
MASFFLYWRRSSGRRVIVCNRYFFDNLAHYHLEGPSVSGRVGLLRRLMPRPDLALLMVASSDAISLRRPGYAPEYVQRLGQGYQELVRQFPELVVVESNPGADTAGQLESILKQRMIADAI